MIKRIFLLYLLLSLSFLSVGQNKDKLQVAIGDTVPQIQFRNLINYTKNTAQLSEFRGKLVVLDFWTTTCSACIASWPKLIEMQSKFKDQMKIILVNTVESRDVINRLIERRKKLTGIEMSLTIAYGDADIEKYFPHNSVPHLVWIDASGRLVSVTDGPSLKPDNIRSIIDGRIVEMPQKIDNSDIVLFEFGQPVFVAGNGGVPEDFFAGSIFGKGNKYLFPACAIGKRPKLDRVFAMCSGVGIKDMYKLAYSNRYYPNNVLPLMNNRVELEVRDSSRLVTFGSGGEIQPDNLYMYQLLQPTTSFERLQELMREDLKRFIGLEASWEKRRKACFVLNAFDTTKLMYKGGERRSDMSLEVIDVNKITVKELIQMLEDYVPTYFSSSHPIVDGTNFKGMIGDLKINGDIADPKKLNNLLRRYGMSFSIETRDLDVLVLREPSKGLPKFLY